MTDTTETPKTRITPIQIVGIGLLLLIVGSYFTTPKTIQKPIVVKKDATCKLNEQPTAVIQVTSTDVPKKDTPSKSPKNFKRHNRGAFPGDK